MRKSNFHSFKDRLIERVYFTLLTSIPQGFTDIPTARQVLSCYHLRKSEIDSVLKVLELRGLLKRHKGKVFLLKVPLEQEERDRIYFQLREEVKKILKEKGESRDLLL